MKRITLLSMALLAGQLFSKAQTTSCSDLNGYPQSKNTGSAGSYTLTVGAEENAAQTYHYSGPGGVTGIRVYGSTPNILGVNLIAKIYNVDASGRPTSVVGNRTFSWSFLDNLTGYKDVNFTGSGYNVNANFAAAVEISGGFVSVTKFQVGYNGDGEGKGEDLASLSGTSTGSNWASAKNSFSKNGDFYIIPRMRHYITAGFDANTTCANTNSAITFTNTSEVSRDSMFNKIGLAGYSGSEFFYTWNFGDGSTVSHAVSPSHSYTSAGVYTVTLKATVAGWGNTCSNTYTKTVSVGLGVSISAVSNVTCNAGNNGSIAISAAGGSTPYKYSLNGDIYQTGSTFSGLSAGQYTVYVKDALGCIKTTSASVTMPGQITFNTPATTNASCGNSNGALLVSAGGGSGTLQYSLNGTTWQSTGAFNNLAAGSYTAWAKDANGCINAISVIVNDLGGPALAVNSVTQITCYGGSNGAISVSGTGGSGTLQYSIDGTNFQAGGTFNNLSAGTFGVIVKDASGCTDIRTVTVSAPPQLMLAATTSGVSCTGGNDGKITVTTAIGGTGTLTYSINGTTYQSSGTFNGLTAGNYTVHVKDVANCTATTSVTVTQPNQIVVNTTTTNASCYGADNAAIIAVATGGTSGYTFSINGTNFYPAGEFSELTAGTYTVTAKDAIGCTGGTSVTLTQPAAITATITTGNSTCGNSNGNILASANGGSGSGFQYSINGTIWNTNGSFTGLVDSLYVVIVKDGSNCSNVFQAVVTDVNGPSVNTVSKTNISCYGGHDGSITITNVTGGSGQISYSVDGSPAQSSNVFAGLTAGSHIVIASDAAGCSGSFQVTLTQPNAIVVSASATNATCYNGNTGSISITAGGGLGTLAYSIDGANYQSSNVFNQLYAGTYVTYVRDAAGCIGQNTKTILEPAPVVISGIGTLDITCNGDANGSIGITASGGTGALVYSINGIAYQSSPLFDGLNGGVYIVYVKDTKGCIRQQETNLYEPEQLAILSNQFNVMCSGGNNGVIDVTATGGTAPYAYNWSNDLNTEDVFNLKAGAYTLILTDVNGCNVSKVFNITQPANPLVVNGAVNNVTSSTAADGSVDITVTGGTSPYGFSWSNGSNAEDLSGLTPGTYTVTITDANNCITSGVFTVSYPLGVNGAGAAGSLSIYPNPAKNQITINAGDVSIDKVEVVNMLGEIIYRNEPLAAKTELNVSEYVNGIYFVRMYFAGNTVTRKIQVSK